MEAQEHPKVVAISQDVAESFKAAFGVDIAEDCAAGQSPEQVAMRMALTALGNDDLQAKRSLMVEKRAALKAKMAKMGDMKYSTPEGSQCMSDCYYYDTIIWALEGEMRTRLMTLDD